MSIVYVGVRAELPGSIIKKDYNNLLDEYNSSGDYRIFDIQVDGRITMERINNMLTARGADGNKKKQGMINFALMIPAESKESAERVVQIVNVLGNNKLIRERVLTFVDGSSALCDLPELCELRDAFTSLNDLVSGFVMGGWYYAPEVIF